QRPFRHADHAGTRARTPSRRRHRYARSPYGWLRGSHRAHRGWPGPHRPGARTLSSGTARSNRMTRTRSIVYTTAGLVAVGGLNVVIFGGRGFAEGRAATTHAVVSPATGAIAGPGRVEAVSEDVQVSAQLGGKLRKVCVDEGDHVAVGT